MAGLRHGGQVQTAPRSRPKVSRVVHKETVAPALRAELGDFRMAPGPLPFVCVNTALFGSAQATLALSRKQKRKRGLRTPNEDAAGCRIYVDEK